MGHVQACRQFTQGLHLGRVHHEQPGLGAFKKVAQFGRLVGRVERHIDHARAQAGEVKNECGYGFFYLHHHAIARSDAQAFQPAGHAGRLLVQIGKAVARALVGLDGGALQVLAKGVAEQGVEVV
jgi:hypothetical protein